MISNKTICKIFVLAPLVFFAAFKSVEAQSFYSSRGIGLVDYFVSGRSSGMAGVGLAMTDGLTVNFLNPASLSALTLTTISGNFRHSVADLKNSTQAASITDTNVLAAQFVIPLKQNRAAFSLGLIPYSSSEVSFTDEILSDELPRFETVSYDGGLNTGFLSLSIRPFNRLYLGATGLFYFGLLRNIQRVDFTAPEFINTQAELSQSVTGVNFRVGVIFRILSNWNIAGVLTPGVTLNADNTLSLTITEFPNVSTSDIELPLAFGIGTSFGVGRKLLVGIDYYQQQWSKVGNSGFNTDSQFNNNSQRIALGLEYSGRGSFRESYFSRMAVRTGIYYKILGLEEPVGQKVTELFGTIGLGLPIKWSAGRLDLAFEAGKRGSSSTNPFRENVIRLTGSITVGERWFLRRR